MSSVEELVMQAKQGGDTGELWQRLERLIYKWCYRYHDIAAQHYLDMDDLTQTAYFGMLQAVQAYDPRRDCKFSTMLWYFVTKSVRELLGLRGKKRRFTVSLDKPISEDGDTTMLDLIPDSTAGEPFEQAEERVSNAFIWQEVDRLPAKQAEVLRERFKHGRTLKDISAELGVSFQYVRQIQAEAMRRLRKNKSVTRYGRECEYAWYHVGVASFQRTSTSTTELAVLLAEQDKERSYSGR